MRLQPRLLENACRIVFIAAVTVGIVFGTVHFYGYLILVGYAAWVHFFRSDDDFRGWTVGFAIGAAVSAALTTLLAG
jgi:hypothetical protein